MRSRFDEQLATLNSELMKMGALCEEAISYAVKSLLSGDKEMKENAAETEKLIDRKERDIEALCMKLLVHQQPVASDFRTVTAALKMISDMERIGDQAEDIAEIAEYASKADKSSEEIITQMAETAVKMVMQSVDSYIKRDTDIAYSVIKTDDEMDRLFCDAKYRLIESVREGEEDAEALLDLLMTAKYFERIGDHAENIAEWVIFSLTGKHE